VEISDWSMSVRQQGRVAAHLTPLLTDLFGAEPDAVNVRFHSYPPTDFAVGGRLLSARVPRAARLAKRLLG
jgi:phenylpyruvate tautomerase PptA (4-oxalocrotonate tautomerase family)